MPKQNSTRQHGVVLRYDTGRQFTNSNAWSAVNTADFGTWFGVEGFSGGVYAAPYVYFVPFRSFLWNYHGWVMRYNTGLSFTDPGSWEVYNAGWVGGIPYTGFSGGVFDGSKWIYFVPQGAQATNRPMRYDTSRPFTDPARLAPSLTPQLAAH